MDKTSNNFDILRLGLAILVYFMHWNNLTESNISNQLFHMGDYAVDMFFIVSGFLIFWSFDNDQNKKHFYIKRFFRIFPLYFALIVLQTIFFIAFSDGSTWQIIKYFLSNISFLNFLSPSVGTTLSGLARDAINGSLWTLKNEVIFYVLVPIIFLYYKKWGIPFLLFLYTLSVFYMFAADFLGIEKLFVLFPAQLRLFMTGILYYVLLDKVNKKTMFVLFPFSLITIILLNKSQAFTFSLYPLFLGAIVVFLAYYIIKIKIKFDFSYSFYILHFPITPIQLALYFGINPINPIQSFVTLFCCIVLLSYFSEKYIEKRFIQIGKSIIKK
jgi:peptidoglycan/LPS O-acetylase OafA/YrhL